MPENLRGKVVLVCDANSGIGQATAELFAARGASVMLAARRKDELSLIADRIVASGGNADFIAVDISRATDAEAMVKATVDRFGRIDACASAAGIGGELAPIVDLSEEGWDGTLHINLKGAFSASNTRPARCSRLLMAARLSLSDRWPPFAHLPTEQPMVQPSTPRSA